MFAAASAVRAAAPDAGWLAWLGYPLAIGVGVGMIWNDRHWASDVVSGALLGEAIGSSAGASFASDAAPDDLPERALPASGTLTPLALPGGAGLEWRGAF